MLSFQLVTVPGVADVQVDVDLALQTKAAPDSAKALQTQLASMRAQMDECQASSAGAGANKVAALFLAQSADSPQAYETHGLSGGDKQNRLLVEAKRLYRLLGMTYIVLSVENRDPQRMWVMDRPVVKLTGAAQDVELRVAAHTSEMVALPPDTGERVVVAFATPQSAAPGQRYSITLLEKDGQRRAELKDLEP